MFDPAAAADAAYGLRVDGQWFSMTVTGPSIAIAGGRPQQPTVTFDTDAATLRAVAFGRETIARAEREGRLTVHGDRATAEGFPQTFTVPTPRA